MRQLLLIGLLFGFTVASCSPQQPFDPELVGHDFYVCCNLRFNQDRDANDANYAYPDAGTTIEVGSRVRVTEVDGSSVRIQPTGDTKVFWLGFKFGREQMSAAQYFQRILLDTDPRERLKEMRPETIQAIREGNLLVGMTKDQAIMARGYPPFHRTAGIEADQWIYYYSRALVDRVHFTGGKIVSIDRGPSPQ